MASNSDEFDRTNISETLYEVELELVTWTRDAIGFKHPDERSTELLWIPFSVVSDFDIDWLGDVFSEGSEVTLKLPEWFIMSKNLDRYIS